MKLQLIALLTLCFFTLFFQSLLAQDMERCAYNHLIEHKTKFMPDYQKQIDKTFDKAKEIADSKQWEKDGEIYRIPVVVHIIYNQDKENLSDELIQSQIDVLNEDFRRMNEDTFKTRSEFLDVAGDAQIEFYLADIGPDGLKSDGITRTKTDETDFTDFITDEGFWENNWDAITAKTNDECGVNGWKLQSGNLNEEESLCVEKVLAEFGFEAMKFSNAGGHDAWPTDRYLNMWVCDLESGLLGYATPPAGAPNWGGGSSGTIQSDGVVVDYSVFGRDNPYGSGFKGRTATHEIGHYLGLRHVWGDGGCNKDDGIGDTPKMDGSSNYDCDKERNTCGSTGDLPDMIENYMDYSSDYCQNMFSNGQIGIMRAMCEGPRAELLEPLVVVPPVADFKAEPVMVELGNAIQFISLSTSAEVHDWSFGDGNQSTEKNPLHTYSEMGNYTITLSVQNDAGFDYIIKKDYIVVLPTGFLSIEEEKKAGLHSLQLLPNPAKEQLQIKGQFSHPLGFEIYNVLGQKVMEQKTYVPHTPISLDEISGGLYFVKLLSGETEVVQKLIVQE